MLTLTDRAREQLKVALADGEFVLSRLRVLISHRCHCDKAYFSLALEDHPSPDDTAFEVDGIPFVADRETVPELPSVEIDFMETVWTKGFAARNVDHQCSARVVMV